MITPKEREVLKLIADGLSSKEIARRLSISFLHCSDTPKEYAG
ncbi:MAG: helix-turn-helix transcriptional regulator [Bacteroidota bacterium]